MQSNMPQVQSNMLEADGDTPGTALASKLPHLHQAVPAVLRDWSRDDRVRQGTHLHDTVGQRKGQPHSADPDVVHRMS